MTQHRATSLMIYSTKYRKYGSNEILWGDMSKHTLLTHNLKAAGSNPAPATKYTRTTPVAPLRAFVISGNSAMILERSLKVRRQSRLQI